MRRIACLYFPLWPIQRIIRDVPELRQQRLVLFHNDSRRGQIVYAASPLALRCGVCRGMPLAEARSLVRQPSNRAISSRHDLGRDAQPVIGRAVIREADPALDRQRLQEIALEMHQFSPLVGLMTDEPGGEAPCSILADLAGLTHLFHGDQGWCTAVMRWLTENGLTGRIAVAGTIGAAWATAACDNHFNAPEISCSPCDSLDHLNVEALRIESSICDTLAELGVHTIGQLRQLPRESLRARFGDSLTRRIDQADGVIDETIQAVHPADSFTSTQSLEYPLADRQTLTLLVQQLVSATAAELMKRQLGALRWRVLLKRYESGPVLLELSLFQPAVQAGHLRQLIEMHLDQLRNFDSLRHPVTEITVTGLESVRMVDRQPELFAASDQRTDPAAIGVLVNCLAARLGPSSVVRPQILAESQPELAMRLHPLTGLRMNARRPRRAHAASIPRPLERPLRLLVSPQPVGIRKEGDRLDAIRMASPRSEQKIVACSGPERIETGWWRAPLVRREYWRIETDQGQRWWIFQDLKKDGGWFLHGVF